MSLSLYLKCIIYLFYIFVESLVVKSLDSGFHEKRKKKVKAAEFDHFRVSILTSK